MTVTRKGKVITINGKTDYSEGEWDAMLRLPDTALAVGAEWSDTIVHPTTGPRPGGFYRVERQYRVLRELPSGDGAGLEVHVIGFVKFNLSMWTDSAAGDYRWFELAGPMDESFVFNPRLGQLVSRKWSMDLRGIGGDFVGGTTDTVPAGLHSENERYRIPEPRAAALMAGLPGPDSSISLRDGTIPLFVHTMGSEATQFVESFRRADGLVSRSAVVLSEDRPVRWTFEWVDLKSDPRREAYEAAGHGLLWGSQRRESPTEKWGVAEYGMVGSLIPSLLVLPDTQQMQWAAYRPTPDEWQRVTLSSRSFDGFRLFVLQPATGGQSVLVISSAGVLLYEEVAAPDGGRVVRVPTTPEGQAQLQRALQIVQGGR